MRNGIQSDSLDISKGFLVLLLILGVLQLLVAKVALLVVLELGELVVEMV